MAVTLAQAKLNVTDDLQLGIIDEFAKSSFIMNNIPFDGYKLHLLWQCIIIDAQFLLWRHK